MNNTPVPADPGDIFTAQITRLLCDESTDNAALALELIRGTGVNRRLCGYLFGIGVFHPDRDISARALGLLKTAAAPDTLRQAFKLREGATYYYNESEFLGKFDNPEIDLFDFLLAAKMCHWHRAGGARSSYFIATHQSLNLTHYTAAALSPAIETLEFIRYIILPANREFKLEASFPYLSKLPIESILIENVRLDTFPTVLFGLRHLKNLTIRRGSSRPKHPMEVPEGGPYGSTSLEKLCIESYPIAGENRLGPFPRLREATLTRCALAGISFLEQSTALEHLNVGQNHLENIPAFLSECRALEYLDLSGNPLASLHFSREKIPLLDSLELKWTRKKPA